MDNNDILRRTRYIFDFNDDKMMELFADGGIEVSRSDVSDWLKKEEDESYKVVNDKLLATFLNGLINLKRGKKEGPQPNAESRLNNNIILRKFKIALNLKNEDILAILDLADFRASIHEITAFFRKPDQRQYRLCKDQILRNFLNGLQYKLQPNTEKEKKIKNKK
jgi:uncharacterized protein YehS (DUF1456 family)